HYPTLGWYADALDRLAAEIDSADAAPTPHERAVWASLRSGAEASLRTWNRIRVKTPMSP
nr:hypothetical protein [Candidatus Eremiobacteraeota bacterium]